MARARVKRDLALICDSHGVAMVRGDITALEELITNLIKNSIAYTPAGGTITVSAGPRGRNDAVLSVRDTGIGIPPKDLPKIFEPFYRGANAFSQRTGKRGSGVGLTMVQEIVKLHHGGISVQSVLGAGTTIIVSLPKIAN